MHERIRTGVIKETSQDGQDLDRQKRYRSQLTRMVGTGTAGPFPFQAQLTAGAHILVPVPWAFNVPALLHFPQIASELKDTISTRLRSARNSISVPIASTSDKVMGAALASCELAWGVAKDTAEYAASTRAGRLASGGADLALGGVEKVVELLLPPAKEESGICC